jgi:putative ABC transport system permease protein
MLYRVDPAGTTQELAVAAAQITDGLPPHAVVSTVTWLDLKTGVDRLADLYVPVLLAFAVFALLAAAFTIANVVSGVVLAGQRDIGVMKAIGFTPRDVARDPARLDPGPRGDRVRAWASPSARSPASRSCGTRPSRSACRPSARSPVPVIAGVFLVTIATAALAAALRTLGATRLSPVTAMTRGTTGSRSPEGGRLRRLGHGPAGLAAGTSRPRHGPRPSGPGGHDPRRAGRRRCRGDAVDSG